MIKFKVIKNEILKKISYTFQLEKNLGKPIIRQLEPTNACMMNCIMCPRKNMKRKIKYMDMEFFKKIIDQAKWNYQMFLHHFGDPLMHPKIDEMIEYVAKKGIKAQISVNPKLLSEKMSERLIDSGLDMIMISIDGVDDKTYKYFRGKNADYEEAVKNIDNFLRIKNKKHSNVKVVLSLVRMKANKKDVKEFEKIWDKKGVNQVLIKQFTTFDGSDKVIMEQGDSDTLTDQFKTNKRKYCSEPWMGITITAEGNVVPCCYDYDEKYIIGNLKEESLEQIWNNKRMRLLRRQVKTQTLYDNPLCKTCHETRNESMLRYILDKFSLIISSFK